MKLTQLPVSDFADQLASSAPAPGGGAAAALTGALGAALTAMVCNLTVGKEQYDQALAQEAGKRAEELTARFVAGMDRDAESFQVVSAAYKMPKGTDEERAARSAAIQEGLKGCTRPPFELMELAVDALELTDSLLGKSNQGAVSDLGVAALSLRAAIQGAWLNVLVNIGSMKDRALADDYRNRGEALLTRALPLADQIYQAVAQQL